MPLPTILASSIAFALTLGMAPAPAPVEQETSPPVTARAAKPQAQRVLMISMDGLSPKALRTLGPKGAPNFYRMIRNGSSTLNARTEVEMTVTLPNHTGMMTSLRVNKDRGGHGVTFNTDDAGTTVLAAAGHYVSSVFDVAHDRGKTTALYSAKDKFALFDRTWSSGRADTVGPDNGSDKLDTFLARDQDETLITNAVVEDLEANKSDLIFWHVGAPDAEGHANGWLSPSYMNAVRAADRSLGRVLDSVQNTGTVVILTADHGGTPNTREHSDSSNRNDYTVPFMVWGSQVPRGKDLYRLNPDFRRPGSAQPGYFGVQPVRNGMAGNMALDLLGLPAIPGSELNRKQNLEARR